MPLFLLPLLPWLFILIPVGLGVIAFGANLWGNWLEWKTAAIFIGALVGIAVVSSTNSPWAKLLITGILCFSAYLYGNIEGTERTNARWESLRKIEEQRQTTANEASQKEAEERLKELELSSQQLGAKERKANEEALKAKDAGRPAFDIDSIKRLNRLRQ